MPCNNLAVQKLRLTPDVVAELVGSESALDVLRQYLSALLDGADVDITRTPGYRHGSAVPLDVVWLKSGATTVCLFEGQIQVQSPDRARVASLSQALETFAGRVAQQLVTERTVAAIKARYLVAPQNDVTLPTGARILRLSI
jgi:hypothetical protein